MLASLRSKLVIVVISTAILTIFALRKTEFSAKTFVAPAADVNKLPVGHLQALNNREFFLQWFQVRWPNIWLDRFPFNRDQSEVRVRYGHIQESRYWTSRVFENAPQETCPDHQTLTPFTAYLWNRPDHLKTKKKHPILVQDSQPQLNHPDLDDVVSSASDELLPDDHGTHTAGLIAALQNGMGVIGVYPSALLKFFPLRLYDDGTKYFTIANAINGLKDIELELVNLQKEQVTVILLNYALQTETLTRLHEDYIKQLNRLLRYNVIILAPGGNTSSRDSATDLFLPASHVPQKNTPGVLLPIAATDLCSKRAHFSALSQATMLAVPGERIYSTTSRSDFGFLTGTSQSASIAAGIVAWSVDHYSSLNARQLVDLLWKSSTEIDASTKAIDAEKFLNLLKLTAGNFDFQLPAAGGSSVTPQGNKSGVTFPSR